jgi:hypothetical protein
MFIRRHTDMKRVYGEVSVREYFHMMDAVFEDHHVSNELKQKLQAIYPKMKVSRRIRCQLDSTSMC